MIAAFLLLLAVEPAPDLDKLLKQFVDAFAIVQADAADPVTSDNAIYGGAIPGMLRQLDPHSVFFDPQQFEQLQQMERSEQKGFGSVVSVLPGRVIVLQALPGTPSAKAGLAPGDEILAVNNIPLNRLEFDGIIQLLSAARQHDASVLVRRPGNVRLFSFVLTPALVDSPSVDRAFLLDPGYGYIRIASFDPKTARLLKSAIEKLGGRSLKGLVLDLRDDPGGVVQTALESAALFLKPGQKILSVKGRKAKDEEVTVPKTAQPYDFPVAVLIDGKTASAAEILTGALQDHDRAVVLGEPSYGKGLVQSVLPLSSNTAMALTTAFYYTPSGRSIQRPLKSGQLGAVAPPGQFRTDKGREVTGGGGIQPDVFVPLQPNTRLRIALEGSGSFPAFATDYLSRHKISDGFKVTTDLLDDFKVFLSQRSIQPSVAEWLADRDWIQSRLDQEILNQGLGVEKGDEVEMRRDPAVRRALEELTR